MAYLNFVNSSRVSAQDELGDQFIKRGNWILSNPIRGEPIVLIYMGNNRPQRVLAEVLPVPPEEHVTTDYIETSDVILFSEKSSTFDLYCEIRDMMNQDDSRLWSYIERLMSNRLHSNFIST